MTLFFNYFIIPFTTCLPFTVYLPFINEGERRRMHDLYTIFNNIFTIKLLPLFSITFIGSFFYTVGKVWVNLVPALSAGIPVSNHCPFFSLYQTSIWGT